MKPSPCHTPTYCRGPPKLGHTHGPGAPVTWARIRSQHPPGAPVRNGVGIGPPAWSTRRKWSPHPLDGRAA
eukprot:1211082-Prymnesium_polylepis.1